MIQGILRIFAGLCLALLAVLVFIIGHIPLEEGIHIIDPYIDTRFAEGYTPEKFEAIQIGMTFDDVKSIIGQPFDISDAYEDSLLSVYYYTSDGKLRSGDCAWYYSEVAIDTNNIVVSVSKGWNFD